MYSMTRDSGLFGLRDLFPPRAFQLFLFSIIFARYSPLSVEVAGAVSLECWLSSKPISFAVFACDPSFRANHAPRFLPHAIPALEGSLRLLSQWQQRSRQPRRRWVSSKARVTLHPHRVLCYPCLSSRFLLFSFLLASWGIVSPLIRSNLLLFRLVFLLVSHWSIVFPCFVRMKTRQHAIPTPAQYPRSHGSLGEAPALFLRFPGVGSWGYASGSDHAIRRLSVL